MLYFVSKGGDELLDPLHPYFHSISGRRLPSRPPSPESRHDDASPLPQFGWYRRCHNAQQGGQREGSGKEIQLLREKEVEHLSKFPQTETGRKEVHTLLSDPRQRNLPTAAVCCLQRTYFFFSFRFLPLLILSVIFTLANHLQLAVPYNGKPPSELITVKPEEILSLNFLPGLSSASHLLLWAGRRLTYEMLDGFPLLFAHFHMLTLGSILSLFLFLVLMLLTWPMMLLLLLLFLFIFCYCWF